MGKTKLDHFNLLYKFWFNETMEELAYEREDGIKIGRAKGIVETCLEFHMPADEILERLQKKLEIPPRKARKYLKKFMPN